MVAVAEAELLERYSHACEMSVSWDIGIALLYDLLRVPVRWTPQTMTRMGTTRSGVVAMVGILIREL